METSVGTNMNTNTNLATRAGALSLALLFGSSPQAFAQIGVEAEAGAFLGAAAPLTQFAELPSDHTRHLPNAVATGVQLGLRIDDRFGLEGSYSWVPARLHARGEEAHGIPLDLRSERYGATLAVHLRQDSPIQPFVGVGLVGEFLTWGSHSYWERRTEVAGNVSLGSSVRLAPGLDVRVRADRSLVERPKGVAADYLSIAAGMNVRRRIR